MKKENLAVDTQASGERGQPWRISMTSKLQLSMDSLYGCLESLMVSFLSSYLLILMTRFFIWTKNNDGIQLVVCATVGRNKLESRLSCNFDSHGCIMGNHIL